MMEITKRDMMSALFAAIVMAFIIIALLLLERYNNLQREKEKLIVHIQSKAPVFCVYNRGGYIINDYKNWWLTRKALMNTKTNKIYGLKDCEPAGEVK